MLIAKNYFGVDLDKKLLSEGAKIHPDVKTTHSTILEYDGPQTDWVICIQVFVNSEFEEHETIDTVEKMIDQVKINGTLIFNTSLKTQKYERDIHRLVTKSFMNVEEHRYGKISPIKKGKLSALIFWVSSLLFQILRNEKLHQKTYYVCKSKI